MKPFIPELITMKFTVEELKEVMRWYDELEHLDETCIEEKLCEGYTFKAHKLIERLAAEKDKLK